MRKSKSQLLDEVADYYTKKPAVHGDTPRRVDWNGEESQLVRFEQLCKVIDPAASSFCINELGCGYGALLGYLQGKHASLRYLGVDVSSEMIFAAVQRYAADIKETRFIVSSRPYRLADYGIASGIFNVRLNRTDAEWFEYLQDTLDILDATSRFGFSFNCLTSNSGENKKRDYLYYADPCRSFDLCKCRYSSRVALFHDYGLYEFPILVRKKL